MRRPFIGASVALLMTGAACATSSSPTTPAPSDPLALATPRDINADPSVLELDLEARLAEKTYGSSPATPVWTYNGSVPGPLLDAKVGDRLVVHFKNSLPEPTTIHWHGVRLPASMDGTLAMQNPIPPGGTFEYAFTLKDAGLFWFHPHIRSDVQVQKGLYGVIRVRGANEPAADVERVVVLDDLRLDRDGTITETLDDESKMLGRGGKVLLVNGVPNAQLPLRAGALVRLRVVNVANGRFFNVRVAGHRLRVVGTDGGLIPGPYDVESLLISPGERYDVMLIVDGAPGSDIVVTNEPYERGHGTGKAPAMPLMTLAVSNETKLEGRTLPSSFPQIERLPDRPADFPIELDEQLRGEDLVFTINQKAFPDVPMIQVPRRQVRALDVVNKSEMDHPFHLHGTFFQVLARDGVAVRSDSLANKDTVIVPANSSLRLVARFDEPGKWMYHCHIFEHAELGMMGEVDVE